jgi:pyruvate kinase
MKIPRTKIIATLGPVSSNPVVLARMMRAGLDVVRLNFSHGTPEELRQRVALVLRLNEKTQRRIRILGDLAGHRIRLGMWPGHQPIVLGRGQVFSLIQAEEAHEKNAVSFDYLGSLKAIKPGQAIYIDDGNIFLKVVAVAGLRVKTRVMVGGLVKERKGVNMPGAALEFGGLSAKDRLDIDNAVAAKLDYLAQSFVREARDMRLVRDAIGRRLPGCKLVAKIESREGIENIESIVEEADGIMIARGDMGVCVPVYEVPIIQKQIITLCNKKRKFVITATQMLESMTEHRLPTRAEATDVANAVLDGTDFVMLSAETATGRYPAESVDMMNKIIKFTENWKSREAL